MTTIDTLTPHYPPLTPCHDADHWRHIEALAAAGVPSRIGITPIAPPETLAGRTQRQGQVW